VAVWKVLEIGKGASEQARNEQNQRASSKNDSTVARGMGDAQEVIEQYEDFFLVPMG
jgi:hypothetical protein